MGRPPLPIGTWGEINVSQTPNGKWRACAYYRDYDGKTRQVERHGKTKTAAKDRLREALRDRARRAGHGEISADTRVSDLGERWLQLVARHVADGRKAPSTLDKYQYHYDQSVKPALGNLKIRECSTGRVDGLVQDVADNRGKGAAKLVRSVVSGMFSLAARLDAVDYNPTRDVEPVISTPKKARALQLGEIRRLRKRITADQRAVDRDLPDFIDFLLGTGMRLGEACAVMWDGLDLEAGQVEIRGTVVRLKGRGLVLQLRPKSEAGYRTLKLPAWVVTVLKDRKKDAVPNEWDVVFTSPTGLLRDPSNTQADIRDAVEGSEFEGWLTARTFRKTAATVMDDAGISARLIADQLGHAKPSMTQDVYMARGRVAERGAEIFEAFYESDESPG